MNVTLVRPTVGLERPQGTRPSKRRSKPGQPSTEGENLKVRIINQPGAPPLPRSDALGQLHERGQLVSSEAIELNERYIAGAQLLAVWPDFMHHVIVGLTREEFDELGSSEPMRVEGLFRAHSARSLPARSLAAAGQSRGSSAGSPIAA